MRAVNLLPRDAHRGGRIGAQQLPALVGGGMGVLVLAVLAGGYIMAASKVAAAHRGLDAAQAQLAATPLPPQPSTTTPTVPQPTEASSELQPRLDAVSSVLAQRIAWDRILRELSLVLPDDVWITNLGLQAPAAGATSTTDVTIGGTTYSYASVARLLSRLSLVPDLTDVTLSGLGSGRLMTFGVTAGIKGAPAPPAAPTPAPAPPPAPTDTTSSAGAGA